MATNMSVAELTTAVKDLEVLYETVEDDRTLGDTFHQASGRIHLIWDALGTFPEQPTIILEAHLSTESSQIQPSTQTIQAQSTANPPPTVENLLNACHENANLLKALFERVSPRDISKTRAQLYRDFLTDNGNDKLVEILVLKLMENTCLLVQYYYGIEEEKLEKLRVAIDELKSKSSSDPNGNHSYMNSGNGNQFNASTGATQNNSTGDGTNFNGSSFTGDLSFGKS